MSCVQDIRQNVFATVLNSIILTLKIRDITLYLKPYIILYLINKVYEKSMTFSDSAAGISIPAVAHTRGIRIPAVAYTGGISIPAEVTQEETVHIPAVAHNGGISIPAVAHNG
jgi:hypothetical protein